MLGLFFFGESLSILQIFIILLVFIGIILIAAGPDKIKKEHFFEKGAFLALVAAVGYGIIDFLTAIGAKTISPLITVWFTWITFTIICLTYITYYGGLPHFFKDAIKYKKLILGMGMTDTLAWVLFAIAVRNNELAITVAITESYPAIGLILGIVANKEKVEVHQYVGAALAVIASLSMGLFIH